MSAHLDIDDVAAQSPIALLELQKLRAENERLRTALQRIEQWSDFPATGRFWDEPANTQPISYGAAYGSNGERDYMRQVAREALILCQCNYPDCSCPFDAPADPNWCARGYQKLPNAEHEPGP